MKYIKEATIKNKTVLLRLDLNVPIKKKIIQDDFRIKKSLKTIEYLLNNNNKVVIFSHLGKVINEEDKKENSLDLVSKKLSNLLNRRVHFINKSVGANLKKEIDRLAYGEVILLENTRFLDFPNNLESNCDEKLSKYWASLGDLFVFDAFGVSHRKHASTSGIANNLPTYLGFLVEEELEKLNDLIEINKKPFVVFMGGAKVESKLPIIKELLPKCDYLLLGGGILNSFLKAIGKEIYNSLATEDEKTLRELNGLYKEYNKKIILSEDFIIQNNKICDIKVDKYINYLKEAKLIFVNGTPGVFEKEGCMAGTEELFEQLDLLDAIIITGGGDTASYIKSSNREKNYHHVSTGGGATLYYIATRKLIFLEK